MHDTDDFNTIRNFAVQNQIIANREITHLRREVRPGWAKFGIISQQCASFVNATQNTRGRLWIVARDIAPYRQ